MKKYRYVTGTEAKVPETGARIIAAVGGAIIILIGFSMIPVFFRMISENPDNLACWGTGIIIPLLFIASGLEFASDWKRFM